MGVINASTKTAGGATVELRDRHPDFAKIVDSVLYFSWSCSKLFVKFQRRFWYSEYAPNKI